MVHAKNYETMSTFVKVMQKKLWPLFFPDTVYYSYTVSLPINTNELPCLLYIASLGLILSAANLQHPKSKCDIISKTLHIRQSISIPVT